MCLLILKNEIQFPFPPSLQGWAKGPNPVTPPSISYSFPNCGLQLAVSVLLASAFLPAPLSKVQKRSERVRRAEPPKPEVVDSTESSK